jgi:hypothetical protein
MVKTAILAFSSLAVGEKLDGKTTVLVFGDSFGDTGPTYHQMQDMFDSRGVPAEVRSSAIGGTSACQWAGQDDGQQVVEQAQKLFPELQVGPDFVWYTMGANDIWQNSAFQSCLTNAKSDSDMFQCQQALALHVNECTTKMLDNFWRVFPKSQVMQSGYDVPCDDLLCLNTMDRAFFSGYCGNNITCANSMGVSLQGMYMEQLAQKYPEPQYTSISLIGAVQKAAGIAGADVGKPVLDQGARCDWTTYCVHPKYGSPAGVAWGDAWWNLYFSKHADILSVSV